MSNKSFKTLFKNAKERDSFWTEKAKIAFAEEVFRLLEAHAISKAEFARRLGCSPAYVTKALCGDVNFTIESMVRLVRAAGGTIHLHVARQGDHVRWFDVMTSKRQPQPQAAEIFKKRPAAFEHLRVALALEAEHATTAA